MTIQLKSVAEHGRDLRPFAKAARRILDLTEKDVWLSLSENGLHAHSPHLEWPTQLWGYRHTTETMLQILRTKREWKEARRAEKNWERAREAGARL